MDNQEAAVQGGVFLFQVLIVLIFAISLYVKKRKQLGKLWEGHTKAKVSIQGKPLNCIICQHDEFDKREALLGTSWLTFFHLNFLNKSGSCFSCRRCGYLHWFFKPNESVEIIKND